MAMPQLTQSRHRFPADTARMAAGSLTGSANPALKGSAGTSPLILAGSCTNCAAWIDVCAQDVCRFTHRFDARLAEPPSQFAADHSAARLMHKE